MVILIVVAVAILSFGLGIWAGVRVTARNADRLLAVMTPDQLSQLARRARARRRLIEADSPPAPASQT